MSQIHAREAHASDKMGQDFELLCFTQEHKF